MYTSTYTQHTPTCIHACTYVHTHTYLHTHTHTTTPHTHKTHAHTHCARCLQRQYGTVNILCQVSHFQSSLRVWEIAYQVVLQCSLPCTPHCSPLSSPLPRHLTLANHAVIKCHDVCELHTQYKISHFGGMHFGHWVQKWLWPHLAGGLSGKVAAW